MKPAEPEQRFDLDCAQLGSDEAASTLLKHAVTSRDPLTIGSRSGVIPSSAYLKAAGGLSCVWSNGTEATDDEEYAALTISILPDAESQWQNQTQSLSGVDEGVVCTAVQAVTACRTNRLINGYWLRVDANARHAAPLDGGDDPDTRAAVEAYFGSVESAVSQLLPPAPLPEPAPTLAVECAAVLPASEWPKLLGSDRDATLRELSPSASISWDINSGASAESGGYCSWGDHGNSENPVFGTLSWLEVGQWAAEKVIPVFSPTASPTSIDGLGEADSAWIQPPIDWQGWSVNIVKDGDWFQLRGMGDMSDAIPLATEIVGNLNR